jgi:hypothetical protein
MLEPFNIPKQRKVSEVRYNLHAVQDNQVQNLNPVRTCQHSKTKLDIRGQVQPTGRPG